MLVSGSYSATPVRNCPYLIVECVSAALNTGVSSFLHHTAGVLKLLNEFIQCSSTTGEGSTSSDHIETTVWYDVWVQAYMFSCVASQCTSFHY